MGILKIINPATEELFGAIDETTPQELEQFVRLSKEDTSWRSKTITQRVEIIRKIVNLLEQQKEDIAHTMAEEMGKPLKAGRHEIEITRKRIEAFCRLVPEFISDEVLFEDENEKNVVRFEPKGTVAVISPWNAPILVPFASIIPTLLCGNNVMFKPSEYVPFTGLKIYGLFEQLGKEGFPRAAFQIILGGKEVGKYLVESDVDFVALTGSVNAGKEVIKSSAEKLHGFVLELGGKDSAIVLEDADIALAAREIVKSATMYTGQVCFGVERAYCAERIFDLFVRQCVKEMKKVIVGNPLNENTDI